MSFLTLLFFKHVFSLKYIILLLSDQSPVIRRRACPVRSSVHCFKLECPLIFVSHIPLLGLALRLSTQDITFSVEIIKLQFLLIIHTLHFRDSTLGRLCVCVCELAGLPGSFVSAYTAMGVEVVHSEL